MTAREKDDFIAAFDRGEGSVRGFAVAGGSFSESTDLAGDRLVGVLILGVGLPQVNIFNETCRDFFEARLGNGYAWAYLYPGLNRVLQAAGSVILRSGTGASSASSTNGTGRASTAASCPSIGSPGRYASRATLRGHCRRGWAGEAKPS